MGAEVVLSRTQIFLAKEVRLWDNVVMANTTQHITLRLSADIVAQVNTEAEREQRSRAWVIQRRLRESYGNQVGDGRAGVGKEPKPDMAALREICAGKVQDRVSDGCSPLRSEGGESPGNGGSQNSMLGKDGHPVRLCVECESPLREVKGKWACADASCAMYGKEQKPR